MAKKKQKKKKKMPEQAPRPKDFLDMIAPAAVKFNTDHFILGSRYHTAMALKSYPPMTDELALLRGLGDMGGVDLRLTARQVTPAEEDAILMPLPTKAAWSGATPTITSRASRRSQPAGYGGAAGEAAAGKGAAHPLRRVSGHCRRGYGKAACGAGYRIRQLVRSRMAPIRCSCGSGRAFSPPTSQAAASLPILRNVFCLPGALPICTP